MSTPFYDLASLVVVPSGYKASKVYAQKPLTTDGQLTFSRASTATRVNSAGLIETVSSNVPRLDYQGSTCPKLLLEPQRTNSAQYSEQADNAYWLKYLCTITANQGTAPDGTMSADLFTTGSVSAVIYKTGIAAGSLSFFVKAVSLNSGAKFYISVDGVGAAYWNQDGTLSSVTGGTAANAVSYGNGWYRCALNVTSGSVINYGLYDVTGSDRTCLIWGMQNEASASYPTSYIPTTSAAVTRLADALYDESASSLIGQTEGTLFAQFKGANVAGGGASRLSISSGTSANWIFVGTESNDLRAYVRANSSVIFSDTTVSQTGNDKIAIAYKSGSIALYINGVQIATSSSTFTFSATLDDVTTGVGGSYSVDETLALEQLIVFPTRLTNAQLAELTAL